MHAAASHTHTFAIVVLAVAVGLAVALAPGLFVPCDFIAFWSSATLFTDRHNPYDPTLLLPLQHEAGFRLGYAITMFNPPWVLPLLAPLAALPVQSAFAVWLAVQLSLVLVAAGWMWQAFGGNAECKWVAAALSVAFTPTFLLLTGGQLTGLALFGLAGFLRFRPARPALAGCLGALTAVKPHLFGLFAVALVIDAGRCRDGRKAVLTGVFTLLTLSAIAVAVTPGVFADYRSALTAPSNIGRGMADYPAPVLGVMLRDALPARPWLVVFLPLAVGAVVLLNLARRIPAADRWATALPLLVAGSLVVAPYGAWWYDMVLLLPLVLLAAVRINETGSPALTRLGLAAFVLLDVAILALYRGRAHLTPLFALIPPMVVLGYFALVRPVPQPQPAA